MCHFSFDFFLIFSAISQAHVSLALYTLIVLPRFYCDMERNVQIVGRSSYWASDSVISQVVAYPWSLKMVFSWQIVYVMKSHLLPPPIICQTMFLFYRNNFHVLKNFWLIWMFDNNHSVCLLQGYDQRWALKKSSRELCHCKYTNESDCNTISQASSSTMDTYLTFPAISYISRICIMYAISVQCIITLIYCFMIT